MKLSMSLIVRYLNKYTMDCDLVNDQINIQGVRFLSDQRLALSSEYVYLGKADSYFSDNKYANACLIVNGKSRVLCYNCDHEELLNDLLGAFEYYNAWEQQLWAMAARHATVQEMMDTLVPLLDTVSTISDLDGNILGSVHTEHFSDMAEIAHLIQYQKLPTYLFQNKYVDGAGKLVQDIYDLPRRFYSEDRKSSAVSMYLVQDGERVAFMQIHEFVSTEDLLHIHLESVFAPFLLQCEEFEGNTSCIRSNHSILTLLLKGETVTPAALEKFYSSARLSPPWCVMVFRNQAIQNYTQRSLLIRELNSANSHCFALDFNNEILVLGKLEKKDSITQELLNRMGANNMSIGISMPLRSIENICVAYRQAIFALGYSYGSGIYACRDYALQYLVENIRNLELVQELLHPAIGELEQYDKDNQTQLLQTLAIYMQEDRNQIETAKRLHTHRNTIKYRLERIDQLTGIDFDDWNERNYLNISLLLCSGMGKGDHKRFQWQN